MTYLLELIDGNKVKASCVVVAKNAFDALTVAAKEKREFLLFLGLPIVDDRNEHSESYRRVFLPGRRYPHVGIFLYNL